MQEFPRVGGLGRGPAGVPMSDYDSPWKEALERYFPEFLDFFFPAVHAGIDWGRGHEFLDKELERVVRDAELGRRLCDKLVKVWRKDGEEERVLVHVEVQSQGGDAFANRMYVYNYRLYDRYNRKVASLAVLADEDPSWRPDRYEYELWGTRVELTFPVVKLLDFRERWTELEESDNPFATVTMAHLQAVQTARDPKARVRLKIGMVKRLYEKGLNRADVLELFRFIDWVMALPESLEQTFWATIQVYEEERMEKYITSVERIGIKKGIEQGIEQGIEKGSQEGRRRLILGLVRKRFGDACATEAETILDRIHATANLDLLAEALFDAPSAAEWLDRARELLPPA